MSDEAAEEAAAMAGSRECLFEPVVCEMDSFGWSVKSVA